MVSAKDSTHIPASWNVKGPSHPGEERKLINISLGYEVLPLCMGPAKLCINVSQQTWAFTLPPKKDFQTLLRLFTTLSLSVNHVYATETLGKELGKDQRTLCKEFTYKNFTYTPVHWDKCQTKCLWLIIQLLIGDPMVCGYLTTQMILTALCVIEKVTDPRMEYYHDKGLLGWLDSGLAPPHPRIILGKQWA